MSARQQAASKDRRGFSHSPREQPHNFMDAREPQTMVAVAEEHGSEAARAFRHQRRSLSENLAVGDMDQTVASWNRISEWLHRLEAFRQTA